MREKENILSPKLTAIISKFKERIAKSDEDSFDKIIEFAYTEGSIKGQYDLYNNNTSKQT